MLNYSLILIFLLFSLSLNYREIYFPYDLRTPFKCYIEPGETFALGVKYLDKVNFQFEFYSFNEYTDFTIEVAESNSSKYNSMEYTRYIKPIRSSIFSNDNFFYGQYYEYIFSVELKTKCNYLLIIPKSIPEKLTFSEVYPYQLKDK